MALIKVRGQLINVDIESELREYDWGFNPRWSSDKLIASSPFREDNAPSFFVTLEGEYAGLWGDSGAIEEQYSSGNFVALMAHLRRTDYNEATNYLLTSYGYEFESDPSEDIKITSPKITDLFKNKRELNKDVVTQAISPYMKQRKISDEVQREFGIGYGENYKGFTAIPWHTSSGRLANVKYRSTSDRRFFYEKDVTPISSLVYGLDVVEQRQEDYAVLCEGEVDVLSWRTAGIAAIAVGGAHASNVQLDEIKRSGIKRLYLGGDNDEQGRKLNEQVKSSLIGFVELFEVDYEKEKDEKHVKDANDVIKRHGVGGLRAAFDGATQVQAITLNYLHR